MAFYARVLGQSTPYIDIPLLIAAIEENVRDRITLGQLESILDLDSGESTDAQGLIDAIGGGAPTTNAVEAQQVLLIGRSGFLYTTANDVKTRLGIEV